MTNLVIKDLDQNVELDRLAMRQIVGGSAHMSSAAFQRTLGKRRAFADSNAAASGSLNVQWSPLLRPMTKR